MLTHEKTATKLVLDEIGANWTSYNPLLASGEMGLETDTGKFKVGNGSTLWNSLVYASGIQGIQVFSSLSSEAVKSSFVPLR